MINTLEKMNTVRKIQYCNYDGEVRDVSFSEAHEIVKEYLKAMNDLFKKYN